MQLYSQRPLQSYSPTVIPDDVPVYRVGGKGFFGVDANGYDFLFEAGSIIAFEDEPNKDMEPLNQLATDRLNRFFEKIDAKGREMAEKTGRAYISQSDAFRNAYAMAKDEAKGVRVLNSREPTPILGGKKRGRPKSGASKLEINLDHGEGVQIATASKTGKGAVNKTDKF